MELKIKDVTFPQVIEFNFDELKSEIVCKAALYKGMVYGDEEIKAAKADKAALNKFVKALSDERIKVKKQCLQPYEEFEKKIKELTEIVNEPIILIDTQIKAYDEKKKDEKLEKIKEIWDNMKHPDWLECNRIFDKKWLNVSVSLKKVQEELDNKVADIYMDIITLEKLQEFSFEAIEEYKRTLDLNKAITEGQRLADIQKRKEEAEARKKAEHKQAMQQEEANEDPVEAVTDANKEAVAFEQVQEEPKSWLRFEAELTVDQAYKLKAFFEDENIRFRAI